MSRDKAARQSPPPTQYNREALAKVEDAVGGRQQLIEDVGKIAHLLEGKHRRLAQLMVDPRNDHRSLASLCKEAKLSTRGFLSMLRDTKLAEAQLQATSRIAERIPDVAEDVMTRATRHYVVCPACGGQQQSIEYWTDDDGVLQQKEVDCQRCRATGEVLAEPDHDVQKTALEISGLLKRGGGISIQQNLAAQVNASTGGVATSAQFREATDRLLFPGKAAVAAEEAEAEEPVEAEYTDADS